MRPHVHILILAAGASSRMRGLDKLMQPVGGVPILRHMANIALGTGSPVVVVLPEGAESRLSALAGLPLQIARAPDAHLGMSRSLSSGIAHVLPNARAQDGLMVLPSDMPGFTTEALGQMIQAFRADPSQILRGGTADGQVGHPAIFPRDLWSALASVTGDEGGRSILQKNQGRVRVVTLPGPMAILDLDTPEDWAAWRSGRA